VKTIYFPSDYFNNSVVGEREILHGKEMRNKVMQRQYLFARKITTLFKKATTK
jgi:hypothetical protein